MRHKVLVLLGGAALSVLGVSLASAVATPSAVAAHSTPGPLDSLRYSIRTQYAEGPTEPCADERTASGLIGVPTLVNVGGSFLPDVAVTVVAVPGIGGGPDVLELVVTRLRVGQLRALVEVVITPDSAASGRVAAGPDGCETGLPGLFSATVTSGAAKLTVLATTVAPTATMTVAGSAFDAVGSARANATAVSARLSPVPTFVKATIDIAGPSSYRAHVKTNKPTDLKLHYSNASAGSQTVADATVTTFPGELDLTFTEEKIAYTASAPMQRVDLELNSVTPGEWTSRMKVDLTGVPAAATLLRPSPTHLIFTTPTGAGAAPTSIDKAVLTFSEFDPDPDLAVVVPTLAPMPDQYLVTRVEPHFTVATAKVLGLARADIDSGDPVLVDVKHTAGPFHVLADLVGSETRHLEVDVLNLPATATITYSPTTQEFTYDGSAVIDELTADVTSSLPFVKNADESHLRILSLPTGLTGRLDATGKTFTSTVTGGAIGTLEVGVTSGRDTQLPGGQQGVLVADLPAHFPNFASYDAFVRVLGLESATVAWGTTQVADVTHLPGSFVLQVDTADLDVDGIIQDLPHQAYISYGPTVATPPEGPSEGPPDSSPDLPEGKSFVYRGSAPIGLVALDVEGSEPLFDDATEAHIDLHGLPKELIVTMLEDARQAAVATKHGPVGSIDIELCSEGACDPPPTGPPSQGGNDPAPDGLWVDDLTDSYHAKAHLTGLERLELSWGDVVGVRLLHTANKFNIELAEDETTGTVGQITYPVDTKVVVDALPADAKLTYDPISQHVTYRGSAPIASIDARRTLGDGVDTVSGGVVDSPASIVGRATSAHLVLNGLPTTLDLTFQFGSTNEKLVIDAGTASVEHVSLDLLSDPSLLTVPSVASNLLLHGRDGLTLWDLHDDVADWDGVLDPYLMMARITNLQRVAYRTDADDLDSDRAVDLKRSGPGTDLYVEIRGINDAKNPKALDGFANRFRYEGLHIWYDGAPSSLGFTMQQRDDARGNRVVRINAYGSAVGARLHAEIDTGALIDLVATATDIPIGTATDPGIRICVAPKTLDCVEAPYNELHGNETPLSLTVDVSSPITLGVHLVAAGDDTFLGYGTRMQVDVTNARIQKRLRVAKESDTSGANSTVVYLDTDFGAVSALVRIFDDGDLDTEVYAPPGTRAKDRYVEVENEGVLDGRNRGYLTCPSGFTAHTYLLGNRLSLNDDVCTRAVLSGVARNVVPADGLPHTIDLFGASFASDTVDQAGNYLEGTHLCLGSTAGDTCSHEFSPTTWLNPFFMRMTIIIPVGTLPGDVELSVQSNTDTVVSSDSPAACTCVLTIVEP